MSGCATPTPAGSDAMSSISTPTSAGSYTEADVAARLGLAADCADYFKVKQISELLRSKGVKPQGKKAQKCKQVALVCTEHLSAGKGGGGTGGTGRGEETEARAGS